MGGADDLSWMDKLEDLGWDPCRKSCDTGRGHVYGPSAYKDFGWGVDSDAVDNEVNAVIAVFIEHGWSAAPERTGECADGYTMEIHSDRFYKADSR